MNSRMTHAYEVKSVVVLAKYKGGVSQVETAEVYFNNKNKNIVKFQKTSFNFTT